MFKSSSKVLQTLDAYVNGLIIINKLKEKCSLSVDLPESLTFILKTAFTVKAEVVYHVKSLTFIPDELKKKFRGLEGCGIKSM